jgi:hypothetical protein
MVVKYVAKPGRIIGSSAENASRLKAQADTIDIGTIEAAIRLLSEYINIGRYSDRPRILLETAAVRIAGGLSAGGFESGMRTSRPAASGYGTSPAVRNSVSSAGGQQADSVAGTHAAADMGREPAFPENKSVREEAPSSSHDEEPELIIAPAPREQVGSPDVMWNMIVDTIARTDRSFVSLIGRASRGTGFDAGELTITVRPNKIKMAEDKLGDITRAARGLYGSDIFVSLKAGDPAEPARAEAVSEQETAKIIEDDKNVSDLAADVESLFGMKPEITG